MQHATALTEEVEFLHNTYQPISKTSSWQREMKVKQIGSGQLLSEFCATISHLTVKKHQNRQPQC